MFVKAISYTFTKIYILTILPPVFFVICRFYINDMRKELNTNMKKVKNLLRSVTETGFLTAFVLSVYSAASFFRVA